MPSGLNLRQPPSKMLLLVALAFAFVCLHAIALLVFRSQATLVTYPFLLLCPTFAIAACGWRATKVERKSRTTWILLGAGLMLWTAGIFLSAWEDLFQHLPQSVAWFSDLAFFLYGVPVLLAVSSVSSEPAAPFFRLDGRRPGAHDRLSRVHQHLFRSAVRGRARLRRSRLPRWCSSYNAENLLLAVAATLRLIV